MICRYERHVDHPTECRALHILPVLPDVTVDTNIFLSHLSSRHFKHIIWPVFQLSIQSKVSTAHQYIVLFLFVSRALNFTEPFNLRVIGEPAFPRSLQSVYINYTCGTNLDKLYVQFCAKICPTFYY